MMGRTCGCNEPFGAFQGAGFELKPEKAPLIDGAREDKPKRVAAGKLKQPEKIGAAAERALQRSHGYRYYSWDIH